MTQKKFLQKTVKDYYLQSPKRFIGWSIVIILLLVVIIDLTPFGGNIKFYAKWIECGQKPVALVSSRYMNSGPRYYFTPLSFEPIRYTSPNYLCSPLDAEKAGYSASPTGYEFPHLYKR